MFSTVEFLEAVAAGFALARLFRLGLGKRQPALFTFLLANAASLIVLSSLPRSSHAYFWTYIVCNAVSPLIALVAVREMFALVFGAYPGIRTAGRWAMYAATGLAVALSVAVSAIFYGGGANGRSHLYYVQIVDRSLVLSLAIVVIAIMVFLSRYPLHLHRNTYVSTGFFSAVFLSEALVLLIDNLSRNLYSTPADIAQIVLAALFFAGWGAMLRPEEVHAPGSPPVDVPAERELLLQLESLNALLVRAARS